jgi:hypothetical protein
MEAWYQYVVGPKRVKPVLWSSTMTVVGVVPPYQ